MGLRQISWILRLTILESGKKEDIFINNKILGTRTPFDRGDDV